MLDNETVCVADVDVVLSDESESVRSIDSVIDLLMDVEVDVVAVRTSDKDRDSYGAWRSSVSGVQHSSPNDLLNDFESGWTACCVSERVRGYEGERVELSDLCRVAVCDPVFDRVTDVDSCPESLWLNSRVMCVHAFWDEVCA